MRRYGEALRRDKTYRRRPGVYAILERAGSVLLTHQMAPVPEVQLPGGGIDPGEHPVAALHREIMEETGWRAGGLRRLGAYRRFVYMPDYDMWAEKICMIYAGRPVQRLGAPTEAGHTALWLPLDAAIGQLGSSGDRDMLAAFASGRL